MSDLLRTIHLSDRPSAKTVRAFRRKALDYTLPAPRLLIRPLLWTYVSVRSALHFGLRIFVCEPLFKAYCAEYGRGVRTGRFVHWIQGKGELIVGNNVLVDGKCSIAFAVRFCERPTLSIGDGTGIGHGCSFTIGKRISIGRNCRIAGEVILFDSSGHPTEPRARLAGEPPAARDVRPVTIEDNVWLGRRAIIFPGVTVGEGSVVAAGAVVMTDVPPYTVVAGNPARKVTTLHPGSASDPDRAAHAAGG